MKKHSQYNRATLLAIFTIILMAVTSLSAQNAWGIRAGVNFSKWRSSDKELMKEVKMSQGLLVSLPVELGIAPSFAIQIEPSFIQKGVKSSISETISNTTYASDVRSVINYIELPVLAKQPIRHI